QAENTALRRIHNGCREQRAVNSTIADRKSSALKLLQLQFVFFRSRSKIANGDLNFRKAHRFGVTQHRHNQTFSAADRDADVKEVVVNYIGVAHFGVDHGKFLQTFDAGLHEERHEAELDVVLLLESLAIALA